MRIEISLKLRPFFHRPGTRCLIPYTTWEVQVFPAKLKFQNLAGEERVEKNMDIQGPVRGFTVLCDLERGRIEVFGRGQKGYFRYFISHEGVIGAKEKNRWPIPGLKKGKVSPSRVRLSLGCHKKQDWELIQRRCAMSEIFPFWIRLAQLIPEISLPKKSVGTMHLLEEPIENGLLFQAAFLGILSPRLSDENYLGLISEETVPKQTVALGLLHAGAEKILRLFFTEEENHLYILPSLPKEFHAGRLLQDEVDLEWSKKQIKKILIRPKHTRDVYLVLKKGIRFFRVRKSLRQKGRIHSREAPLELKSGQTLYLDRFRV